MTNPKIEINFYCLSCYKHDTMDNAMDTQIVEVGRFILPSDLINEISELVIELRRAKCEHLCEQLFQTCNLDEDESKREIYKRAVVFVKEILDDDLLTQQMCSSFDWFDENYKLRIKFNKQDISLGVSLPEKKNSILYSLTYGIINYIIISTD